ncbi:MAG: FG-GAP-like repeat-containing protein [Bacteroidota bacterium]
MKKLLLALFINLPILLCAQATFVDRADAYGMGELGPNYGVSVVDYNNDGWEDVYITRRPGPNRLYKNINGQFVEVAASAGLNVGIDTKVGIWGDFDNDGWVDIFLGNRRGEDDMLFKNNGDGTFTDISISAGIQHKGNVFAVVTGDVNNDGYLDIYVADFDGPNVLWRNNGNMTFTDITVEAGVTDNLLAMGASFLDFDNDGDLDLYLTHDGYGPNIMFSNDGTGHFTDVAPGISADVSAFGMGVDVGDINNDGWTDIYITNLYPNNLLLNDGDGSYTDITQKAGVGDPGMGWGTVFFDADNDGYQDIYMGNTPAYPNQLYINNQDNTFTAVAQPGDLSSPRGAGYGLATLDYDKDGRMDMILANSNDTTGVQVFHNETINANNWFAVKVLSNLGNKTCIGGTVEIYSGTHYAKDMISGGSSWVAQSSPIMHFGMGNRAVIDSMRVTWTSGLTKSYFNLPVNQIYSAVDQPSITSLDELERKGIKVAYRANDWYVSLPPSSKGYEVNFLDMWGRKVKDSQKINSSSKIEEVSILHEGLARGIYLLSIKTGEQIISQKLVLP